MAYAQSRCSTAASTTGDRPSRCGYPGYPELELQVVSLMGLDAVTETSQWLSATWAKPVGPFIEYLAELSNLSFLVPGSLEDCDKLRSKAAKTQIPHQQVELLFHGIAKLESKLHAWTAARYREAARFKPRRIALDEANFPVFNARSQTFARTYDFADFSVALSHQPYWLCLLALSEAQLEVLRMCQHKSAPMTKSDDPHMPYLESYCEHYADSLCRSSSFLRKESHGTWALLATVGPLYFASLHYIRYARLEKLHWCVTAAMELEELGIQTPFSRDKGREDSPLLSYDRTDTQGRRSYCHGLTPELWSYTGLYLISAVSIYRANVQRHELFAAEQIQAGLCNRFGFFGVNVKACKLQSDTMSIALGSVTMKMV